MNRYGFEPDFDNLKTVLKGSRGHRVPNAELVIDREIKETFLGRSVESIPHEIEFRYRAGYDYLWLSVGMIDPAGTVNKEFVPDSEDKHFAGKDERVWADKPIIYHSDGDLSTMIDTIVQTGFHALHHIEPESMDIYAVTGNSVYHSQKGIILVHENCDGWAGSPCP